jgi:hypothetical protein
MEIFKRKENYANPVGTAKSNFAALAFLYIILSLLFFNAELRLSIVLLISALVMLISAYFLSKNKIIGVYFGWAFIIFGIVSVILNGTYAGILVLAYLAYWNQQAFTALKKE